MSFETDLRTRLKNAITTAGIYWNERPQASEYPAIVIETVVGGRDQHFGGLTGSQRDRVQFSCFATTKAAAVTLRNAVMELVEAPATQGTTEFQGGFVNLHRGLAVSTPAGTMHTEIIDADIWFS